MSSLLFIDTNVFLDFYRISGREGSLTILEHLNGQHERIITSEQIEMEFKKNRQRVILEAMQSHKAPNWEPLRSPAFLKAAQPSKMIEKNRKDISEQASRLKDRLTAALENPAQKDPVYKILQRLFRSNEEHHLTRKKKERHKIRHMARKRFSLGYPPRKNHDLSIGDAVNWEWIVWCSQRSGKDVVIVSRDSDYGTLHKDLIVLNDWLKHEFRERAGRNRSIVLTDRLAKGYELSGISVTEEEKQEELSFLKEQRAKGAEDPGRPGKSAVWVVDEIRRGRVPAEVISEYLSLFVTPDAENQDDS